MTALVGVVDRICAATNALRIRSNDSERAARNGGEVGDLHDRLDAAVERLERVASELEDMLA